MRPSLVFGAALTLAALLVPSPAGATGPESGSCTRPVPARQYGPDVLAYGVEIDLSGCDWWEGGPIELGASLTRIGEQGEEVSEAFVLCGVAAVMFPDPDGGPEPEPVRNTTCGVSTEMPHPAVEAALYRGEISYPWEDATVTVAFEAACTANPDVQDCIDLP